MEQETLIYIDDKQKYDASVAANSFTNNNVKNRVYINTLGAELGIKYLNSENIDTSDIKNIHSIKKIIEEFDISDIKLKGIHIDVRVVFEENAIFVPKSHFEYGLLPDIYLVFKIEKDYSHVKFLGFFEPKLINKNNANDEYYFIEKEKLNSALDLAQYIESHQTEKDSNLSADDIEKTENLIISMADNDISENDKKYLLEQLTKSAALRDKFIEYETFEILSYKAMTDPSIDKHNIAKDVTPVDEFEAFEDNAASDVSDTTEINTEEITESPLEDVNAEALEEIDAIINEEQLPENIPDETIDNTEELNIQTEETNTETSLEEQPENNTEEKQVPETETLESIGSDIAANVADSAITEVAEAVGEAALAADAVAEIDDIVDTTSANAKELIDNASDIAEDLVDLASDNAEDIINDINDDNSAEPEDAVSVDNVDITANTEDVPTADFEKFDLPSDNEIPEKNIDMSELQGNIMENAVSLDAIVDTNTELPKNDLPEDAISVDNVDITANTENIPIADFEKFDLPSDNEIPEKNIDMSELQGNIMENAVTLDEVSAEIDYGEENKMPENAIALESIDVPEVPDEDEETRLDFDDESSYMDFPEEKPDTRLEGCISLDDIDDSQVGGDDLLSAFGVNQEKVEELTIDDSSTSESFGKNLLENLNDDNTDDILIAGIDNIPQNSELKEPAIDDFLEKVDDVIDTASTSDTPIVSEPQENNEDLDLLTKLSEEKIDKAMEQEIAQGQMPESLDNLDNLDALDGLDALSTTDIDLKEDSILPEQTVTLQEEALPKEDTIDNLTATDNILSELSETKQEDNSEDNITDSSLESTATVNDAPKDYIEDLLDNETSETVNNEPQAEGEDLNVLYKEGEETDAKEAPPFDDIEELEDIEPDSTIPGAPIISQRKQSGGKLIIAAVLVGVIAAASAFYFLKPKDNSTADFEPLPNNSATALADKAQTTNEGDKPAKKKNKPAAADNTNNADSATSAKKAKSSKDAPASTENVLKTNAPDVNKPKEADKKQVVKELKNTAPKKVITSSAYMSVSKLVWDVPDSVSYSKRMQDYLRTTGRSIKLTLSTDLLLATEYAYADSVKVGIGIGSDGFIQSVKIISSSGSSQIDNIVLQSVKETLNAINPPSEDVKGKELNLNLIIYF